jgi:signal transduction histidine kinase
MDRVPDPERRKEYLQGIVRETERLAALVDNVLDFSGAQAKPGRLEKTDLYASVESAALQLQPALERDGYTLEVVRPDRPVEARVDRDRLRQAVLNLMTNACKYSGDSRRIEVRCSCSGGEARISVADWGIGVPLEYRSRIFESFFRAPRANDDSIPGVGLGLALVSEIMRAHGGRVELQENDPRGSVFSLVLPVAKQ